MDKRIKVTPRLRQQVVEMHLAHVTGREITRQLRISSSTIAMILAQWRSENPAYADPLAQESATGYYNAARRANDLGLR